MSQFEEGIALGADPYRYEVIKFGRNTDVDSGAAESIWPTGGTYPWSAFNTGGVPTAQTISVVSNDANDTAGGSGARTIKVFGLDANWALQSENVALNGLTPVALNNQFIRVNRIRVLTAGTFGSANVGTINASVGGTIVATVLPLMGSTQMAMYTVPAGYTGLLQQIDAYAFKSGGGATGVAQFDLFVGDQRNNGVLLRRYIAEIDANVASSVIVKLNSGLQIQEYSDIDIRAIASVDNMAMGCSYILKVVKGVYPEVS